MIRADVDVEAVKRRLAGMADRANDLTPIMRQLGERMMTSVKKNFDQGGRPTPWEPLASGTVISAEVWKGFSRSWKARMLKMGYRRVQGRKRMGGPLVLTGNLRASIDYRAEPRDLVLVARPDPGVKGPVHQWGVPDTAHGGTGRLAGRGHNVRIPARPYLVFQPEDLAYARDLLRGWIRVGSRGGAA